MSQLVRENLNFLNLLLHTTSSQSRALLRTITQSQTEAIREIAHNFDKFPGDLSRVRAKHRFLIRALAAKRISRRRMISLLVANRIQFLHVLDSIADYISELAR